MSRFQVSVDKGIARLTLNNPPHNTLDLGLMAGMAKAVRTLTQSTGRDRPRVIVLASSVPHQFCQGLDPATTLKEDMAGRKATFLALADLVEALWFGYIPVVCDISGPALAGGAVLAATADFAVIDTHAGKISFSEVKVGLPLPRFIQRLVARRVIAPALPGVLLLGRNLDAAEACRIGFADQAYTGSAERDEAMGQMLGRITRLAPEVLTETLRQGHEDDLGLIPAFRQDLSRFGDFVTDEFLGKGLGAVLKGESPRF